MQQYKRSIWAVFIAVSLIFNTSCYHVLGSGTKRPTETRRKIIKVEDNSTYEISSSAFEVDAQAGTVSFFVERSPVMDVYYDDYTVAYRTVDGPQAFGPIAATLIYLAAMAGVIVLAPEMPISGLPEGRNSGKTGIIVGLGLLWALDAGTWLPTIDSPPPPDEGVKVESLREATGPAANVPFQVYSPLNGSSYGGVVDAQGYARVHVSFFDRNLQAFSLRFPSNSSFVPYEVDAFTLYQIEPLLAAYEAEQVRLARTRQQSGQVHPCSLSGIALGAGLATSGELAKAWFIRFVFPENKEAAQDSEKSRFSASIRDMVTPERMVTAFEAIIMQENVTEALIQAEVDDFIKKFMPGGAISKEVGLQLTKKLWDCYQESHPPSNRR